MWLNPTLKELNLAFNLLSELPSTRGWKDCGGSSSSQASSINNPTSLSDASYDSDDVSAEALSELTDSDGEGGSSRRGGCLTRLPLKSDSLWSTSLEIVENAKLTARLETEKETVRGGGGREVEGSSSAAGEEQTGPRESALTSLNLAHNSFSVAPRCLACLTPRLARLNLSYNAVSRIGTVSSYPLSLKHLDLGYNQIGAWPGDEKGPSSTSDNVCYATEAMDALTMGESTLHQQQQIESKKYPR